MIHHFLRSCSPSQSQVTFSCLLFFLTHPAAIPHPPMSFHPSEIQSPWALGIFLFPTSPGWSLSCTHIPHVVSSPSASWGCKDQTRISPGPLHPPGLCPTSTSKCSVEAYFPDPSAQPRRSPTWLGELGHLLPKWVWVPGLLLRFLWPSDPRTPEAGCS